jgi:hypothetical protein
MKYEKIIKNWEVMAIYMRAPFQRYYIHYFKLITCDGRTIFLVQIGIPSSEGQLR